jgi:hypothetical protein
MKKIKLTILISSLLMLASCGSIIKGLSGFKNPEVQNKKELSNYFNEVMPNEKTYFLSVEKVGDSAAIYESFFFGFSSEMKMFSKTGQKYCYNGTSECSGAQMTSAFGEFDKTFIPCVENSDETLQDLISKLVDKGGNKLHISDLPDSDFYIFQNWNTYSSSKKNLKQDSQWINSLKNNSNTKAAVIFVNGDLQEEWGLEKAKKLKTKFRKKGKGSSFDIKFGKLPLIK